MKDNRVLSEDYSKLSVINKETGEEIAVVTVYTLILLF